MPPTVPLYCRAAPAQSAGAVRRRLLVGGLVDDEHHVVLVLACGQVRGRPVRDGIQQLPLINTGARQQVLHPVGARVPGGLGQHPSGSGRARS
jgi:hypothetical protein